MPRRPTPYLSGTPDLPEDPTDRAYLRVRAEVDPGRGIDAAVSVPGRHTVACARIGAGVVLAVGGPLGDMYGAHVTAFPVGPAACVAVAQVVLGAVIALFGFRARAG